MAIIQLQVQNVVKLANTENNQLANIETTLLQTEENYKTQIEGDIYCGNHQTQSPIAVQGSKSLKVDIKQEVHKRTQ